MRAQQLVVNGCSYGEGYAQGQGHIDLATRLEIPNASSLAIGGSANSRILRTTLKHAYHTTVPTFYVLGMTFLSRNEIPILDAVDDFEGRWTNPQNQDRRSFWMREWTDKDTERFVDLKLKSEIYSILDRLEDLQYRMLSTIKTIQSLGHGIVLFQQADDIHHCFLDDPKVKFLKTTPEIIGGYRWCAVRWQQEQGVPHMPIDPRYPDCPPEIRHRLPGEHAKLNEFLVDYIRTNQLA